MNTKRIDLFREDALRNRSERGAEGDVLRLSPSWTRWTYWLLVAALASALVYCSTGTFHDYAAGPAVVWISGRTHVTSTVPGTVASIEIKPGQKVEAGQVLVRFAASIEEAELARIDREFELQLAKRLVDPGDAATRAAFTSLRTQRDVAKARFEQLTVRAPKAGTIGDVRIRAGQLIAAGDAVLTLIGDDQQCSVLAMLPARYRPQLRSELSIRFEIEGYRYAYQEMAIKSVGDQIIGPSEVKRYLGQEIQDTVTVTGPVVLVEATPPSMTFTVDGEIFNFYHGMSGMAEARVRTEPIPFAIFPGLRVLFGESG